MNYLISIARRLLSLASETQFWKQFALIKM